MADTLPRLPVPSNLSGAGVAENERLVGSLLPMDAISTTYDTHLAISGRKSYLHCGKDRVSVHVVHTADYIEVDVLSEKLGRCKVGPSSVTGGRATGFL